MNFFEYLKISERDIDLINPATPEKIIKVGKFSGMSPDKKVIDFGSGYGEPLILWAKNFGIQALGTEIREDVCNKANDRIKKNKLSDKIKIQCGAGDKLEFKKGFYDVATCVGATFVFGGFKESISFMKTAINNSGKLLICEPYWLFKNTPEEIKKKIEFTIFTETELIEIVRAEDCDIEYTSHSSVEDWDYYEATQWPPVLDWLEKNTSSTEKDEVIKMFHASQDQYFGWAREYLGWGLYVIRPRRY